MGNHDSTINDWIAQNKDQILDVLRRLIKISSDSGKETAICNTIEAMYQELGFNPQRVTLTREQMKAHQGYIDTTQFGSPNNFTGRENVVVKIQGTGGGRSLILNAHMDTIPVENEKSWAHEPLGGEVIGNKLYGRGAADCKAGVVLAFIVARILKECRIKLLGDIIIQNVVEEEFGGLGTLQCALSGQKSDGAIILENTGNKIVVVGGRGVQFFEILIEGKPTMMEYMWTQPSSIDQAIRILQGFRDFNLTRNTLQSHPYYDMYPAELPKAPLNISVINSGIFPGTTAGKVVLKGSAECLPNESIKEMKRSITKFLKRLVTTDPVLKDVKYKLKWWGMMQEPAITPMDHPLIKLLIENGKKELGLVPTAVGAGGSDLRILNLYAQTPTVMYGVDGGNGHGIDEYIEIESLFHTLKIVLNTIVDYCGIKT